MHLTSIYCKFFPYSYVFTIFTILSPAFNGISIVSNCIFIQFICVFLHLLLVKHFVTISAPLLIVFFLHFFSTIFYLLFHCFFCSLILHFSLRAFNFFCTNHCLIIFKVNNARPNESMYICIYVYIYLFFVLFFFFIFTYAFVCGDIFALSWVEYFCVVRRHLCTKITAHQRLHIHTQLDACMYVCL